MRKCYREGEFHHGVCSLDRLKDVQVVVGKKRKDVSTVSPTAVLT